MIYDCPREHKETYILRSSEGDSGDAVDFLQTESQQRLPRLSLSARLDFVERGGRRRVLVVLIAVLVLVLVLVLRMVAGDFLDGCGHLQSAVCISNPSVSTLDNDAQRSPTCSTTATLTFLVVCSANFRVSSSCTTMSRGKTRGFPFQDTRTGASLAVDAGRHGDGRRRLGKAYTRPPFVACKLGGGVDTGHRARRRKGRRRRIVRDGATTTAGGVRVGAADNMQRPPRPFAAAASRNNPRRRVQCIADSAVDIPHGGLVRARVAPGFA